MQGRIGIFFKGPSKKRSIKKKYKGESDEQKGFYGTNLKNADQKKKFMGQTSVAPWEKSHLLMSPVHPCMYIRVE
jgi:hypothetical protein